MPPRESRNCLCYMGVDGPIGRDPTRLVSN